MVAQAMPDLGQLLIGVRGQLVSGVTVVIAEADGEPHAATATAVTVASIEPPLMAIFLSAGGRLHERVARGGRFTVSLLPEDGERLALRLGQPGRPSGWANLADVELVYQMAGPPVLAAAIAWVDCALVEQFPVGDHSCCIGRVLGLGRRPGRAPLVHYRGRFHRLGAPTTPPRRSGGDPLDRLPLL